MDKTEKAVLVTIAATLFLSLIKFVLGYISGSIALIADSIHSFVDLIASAIVFIGLRISRCRLKCFPYGLYKVENFVSLIIALAIFWTGYEIVKEVMEGSSTVPHNIPITLLGIVVTIAITYLTGQFQIRVGKETGSPSLISDGKHRLAEVFTSVIVFIGLMSALVGLSLDRYAALAVVLFILKSGYDVLKDAVGVLLDASLDYPTLDQISRIISGDPLVEQVKLLRGRNSGRYKFVEAAVIFRTQNLETASKAAERIEAEIKELVPFVERVLLTYESAQKNTFRYAIPLEDEDMVSEHFGKSPYFALIDVKNQKIVKEQIIVNPFRDEEKRKGLLAARLLAKEKADVLLCSEDFLERSPEITLKEAGVEVVKNKVRSLQKIRQELLGNIDKGLKKGVEW